jgi:hypothetical protein
MFNVCRKFVLGLFVSSLAVVQPGAQENPLDQMNLSASFVRTKDRITKTVPNSVLTVTHVIVGANDTISGLLRRNGIFPNSDAMGVVYSLNPDLTQLSPLPEKLSIVLPGLKRTDEVNKALKEDFLASLTMDQKLKDDLIATWKSLQPLVMQISAFGAERFSQAEDKDRVTTALQNTTESLHDMTIVLRENNRPLSHEILSQTYNDAAVLLSIVQQAAQPGQKLGPEDQNRIFLIASDMELKVRNLNEARGPNDSPPRWRDTRVIVDVLENQKPVPGLRVYYVPEALEGQSVFVRQFSVLSSPAEQVLPEADYMIWAANENDTTSTTAHVPVPVRKSPEGVTHVQLTLVHQR